MEAKAQAAPEVLGDPMDPLFLVAKVRNKIFTAVHAPEALQEQIRAMFIQVANATRVRLATLFLLLQHESSLSIDELATLTGYSPASFSAVAADLNRYTDSRWEIHLKAGKITLTDHGPVQSPPQY